MDFALFKEVLNDHIREIFDQYKKITPGFSIAKHAKNHNMNYDRLRKTLSNTQEWRLEYFLKVAESFSVPPHEFLRIVLKKYRGFSKD